MAYRDYPGSRDQTVIKALWVIKAYRASRGYPVLRARMASRVPVVSRVRSACWVQ